MAQPSTTYKFELNLTDLGADYQQALEDGWLPIRDVARITGVNAVTLRAWERRYGLIVPHRDALLHRFAAVGHRPQRRAVQIIQQAVAVRPE